MSTFISLLRQHQQAFEQQYDNKLNHDMRSAIHAMLSCQTQQQQQVKWRCTECEHSEQHPISCGHRHCPQCQHQTTSDWLMRQQQKLLPTHYFMVTLTIPYQLRALARYQSKAFYKILFGVAQSTLKDFAKRQNKGEMGFTMVLHTHNRKRDLHPHLHVIIPAGRYDNVKQVWHKGDKHYLFNEFALAKVWRARLLDAINHHDTLVLPQQLPRKWIVDCRHIGYGEHALQYLSRYLYRGVLPDRDILKVTSNSVTFRYRDGQTNQWKIRVLPPLQFIWLILQHALPKGFQRVRDYGFLRGNAKTVRLRIQQLLMTVTKWIAPIQEPIRGKAKRRCPCCQHDMQYAGIIRLS
ncbi:IS91 family transposase [Psychromonas sp. PT13]|uniref:IS91 family transposase n=1 Tax=Psychromonas sp. PT13 TaxID=3439547 RepID=UPI003EB9FA79